MQKKVKKAIIPVGGLGIRFLPATKAQPKEMLPVVDKPVIQYIVEEAVAAGIEEIIFVTAIGKRAIEDHFDRNFELEYRLEQKKKNLELERIKEIGKLANFAFVRQPKPLGDGHAVLTAAHFVDEDEAIAVMFGDDIIVGEKPAIGELIETFEKFERPVIAVEEVPEEKVSGYGIVGGEKLDEKVLEIKEFVEKPKVSESPSNLAVVGRYIITPEVFEVLKKGKVGRDGEIRLADAFSEMVSQDKTIYGRSFSGKRYDCGNKLQFIIAQIEVGLLHPELSDELKEYLRHNNIS
jgi:UTP--glucose-1-phosphate uridylyltransferase